jgi:hypothetical protein
MHNEEPHKLYVSPNFITMIKSRRIRSGTCSTHGRIDKFIQYFGWKGRDHSEDLSVNREITLEWIVRKWGKKVWIGFI